MSYKTKMTKTKSQKHTIYYVRDKNDQNRTKITETKSQKDMIIHSNVQYGDSYKSLHSTAPKNHTKTKTIPLIIK